MGLVNDHDRQCSVRSKVDAERSAFIRPSATADRS
jgi:hypothetical protein